ncbi:alpha/beta fold hydrolase [Sphingomonas daechungensis]|uniref:alpha/beta hydrolase n=1 Tax=Sphingomonas daechungensis TaxID=1176646 RepID=UPI0031F1405A
MLESTIIALAAVTAALTAPGPKGPLAGTFLDAGKSAPVVLIIPGSGPTDRDGNNPLGVTAAPYKMLAEALAERGVSTLRADKRGMFGSKDAVADANDVRIADYVTDARSWIDTLKTRTGASCVWLLGHSEGGLIALEAAQDRTSICGVILIAAPGRKLGEVMRDQLKASPNTLLEPALAALGELEAGRAVDATKLPTPLATLFNPKVQPFLTDLLAKDPARLAGGVATPMLIIQGGRDIQVTERDAKALHAANPKSQLLVIPTMNHVLKDVANDDRVSNLATYSDPTLPVDAELVTAIAATATPKAR